MKRVLLTAFEPYDRWPENASWLVMKKLTADLPTSIVLTTRRYPVDFPAVRSRLAEDLVGGFDYAIHLGQHPRATAIHRSLWLPHQSLPYNLTNIRIDGRRFEALTGRSAVG